MSNFATVSYTIETAGASSAAVAALADKSSVPVPPDILQAAGLRVVTDTTPVATPVVRTIEFAFGPSATATAVATLDNEGRVSSITPTAPGLDYILPPIVKIGGKPLSPALARAFLNVQDVELVTGGTGYSAGTVAVVLGGMAPPTYITKYPPGYGRQEALGEIDKTRTIPPSCVQALRIAVRGKGYSASSKIQFVGTLDPSNPLARPAQAVITAFGAHGEILGVQLIDPGEGYITVPKVIVVDHAHTGGGFMVMQPNPITGARLNPNTAGSRFGDATPSAIRFVKANISPAMGQGTPASISLTIALGIITAAVVTAGKNGARYIQVPQILVFDPAAVPGSGGVLVARMGVGSVELQTGGRGYDSVVPPVTLVPFFKSLFPDASNQAAPFGQLMQTALQVACLSPVVSGAPVLS
jgi:hypothetical protein